MATVYAQIDIDIGGLSMVRAVKSSDLAAAAEI